MLRKALAPLPCLTRVSRLAGVHTSLTNFKVRAGDRYNTDKVQVQLGRDWGHDQGSAIQPCIYPLSSTAQLELPESSSVRALAGQPVLSDLFVPFRQPVQVTPLLPK